MFGIAKLIELGVNAFTSWSSQKSEIKKIKLEGKNELLKIQIKKDEAIAMHELKMIQNSTEQNFDLDRTTLKNMSKTWKDEFILLLFSIPVIMSFSGYSEEALNGFKVMESMPTWFIVVFVLLAVTISGMRNIFLKTISTIKNKGTK
jgi:hypothetical protein